MTQALVATEKIIKQTRAAAQNDGGASGVPAGGVRAQRDDGRKFAEWAGIRYSTFGNWWRARKKSQRAELPALRQKCDGHAVAGSGRGEAAAQGTRKLKSGPLIVHGRGEVRLELSDESQIKLAAQLLRELGWMRDAEFYRESQDLRGGGAV